jgi:hypothetical protein
MFGVDVLKTIRGPQNNNIGIRIAVVKTTDPNPVTIAFEGGKIALDLDIIDIPISLYPLRPGDRLLCYPLINAGSISMRWVALQKLNGGLVMATMQGSDSLIIDGIAHVYGASDLIVPAGFINGDRVSIAPTWDTGKIKYVFLNKY